MSKLIRNDSNKDPLVSKIEAMLHAGMVKKEQDGVIARYNRGLIYYRGDQRRSSGSRNYNKFSQIVDARIAQLSQARPKWTFKPRHTHQMSTAHALQQVIGDVVWDELEWNRGEDGGGKGEEFLLQMAFAGAAHVKTSVNPVNGYPQYIHMPVGNFIPDPMAKKRSQLRYWIHLVPMSVKRIKRDFGKDVKAQPELETLTQSGLADFHRPLLSAMITTSNTMDSLPFRVGGTGNSLPGRDTVDEDLGKAIVAECWMEDFSREKIPFEESEISEEHEQAKAGQNPQVLAEDHHPKHIKAHEDFLNSLDSATEQEAIQIMQNHIATHQRFPQETTQRKYPYGRVITTSQGILLSDRPNPFSGIGLDFKDVVIKASFSIDPEKYWGLALTDDMFDLQDDLNERKNAINKNIKLLNNGIRKIKYSLYKKLNLDKNPSRINNMIGSVFPFLQDPGEYTTDFGKPLPSQFFNDLMWTERFMDTQSAHSEAASGNLPAPGTANSTLETLLDQFQTLLMKPIRHYSSALAKMGQNAALIMAEYMDPMEVFVILGEDQKTFQEIRWGDLRNDATLMRSIYVDTTEMLPTTRMQSFRRVIEMLQAGIPPEVAIQFLDDPKVIQAMETVSEINQLKAMVENLAAENDQLKKAVNTATNRQQGSGGLGNAGPFQTTQ